VTPSDIEIDNMQIDKRDIGEERGINIIIIGKVIM